jgi:tartrate-resistant acid phosphatase type 5
MTPTLITRRLALQGLGLAVLAPLSRAWADSGGASLTFLALGDWGREGNFHQRDVAQAMADTAGKLGARFVISTGDNFYEHGVTGLDDPAWHRSFEKVYDAPALHIPWYVALGNHDYHGNAQAQLDYSAHSRRWRLPSRWHKFLQTAPDGARAEFFMIDSSPMLQQYYADGAVKVKVGDQKRHVGTQLAWLDAALAASRAEWKIVVGHHPVYSGGRSTRPDNFAQRNGNQPDGYPDMIAQIEPILQRHRVPLYLNGHDHDLQHVHHGATHYVCSGAGSMTNKSCDLTGSDFCSLESGFVACALNRSRLRVAYRDYKGVELHVVDIAAPKNT